MDTILQLDQNILLFIQENISVMTGWTGSGKGSRILEILESSGFF